MRIIYLHQYFNTPDMPGSTRSYELAKRLVAAGHEVHMITADRRPGSSGRWRQTSESGICVHWVAVAYDNSMGVAQRIRAFLAFAVHASVRAVRLRGDVIFATSTPLTIALPALAASAVGRRPFVFEVRDMWPDVPIAMGVIRNPVLVRLARLLERVAYARARRVVALAPGMKADIVRKGVPASKVVIIPNGCDLDVFGGGDPARSPRSEHDWLGDRKLVVYAGMVGRVNGVQYLVKVAAAVARRDPDIRFVVIGGGAQMDDVRSLAAAEGVLDRSLFFMDPLPKKEVARWVGAADMLLALITGPRVVWKDAVQNKFFDALAAGKPIASNFEGWQSIVARREDIGLILDPEDADAGAATLLNALSDEAWLDRVSVRARQLAHGIFNRDYHARMLEQVLTSATYGSAEDHVAEPIFETDVDFDTAQA